MRKLRKRKLRRLTTDSVPYQKDCGCRTCFVLSVVFIEERKTLLSPCPDEFKELLVTDKRYPKFLL